MENIETQSYNPAPSKSNFKNIKIGPVTFNSQNFALIAGPCSIESLEQMQKVANNLCSHSIQLFRGGIWKLRTNPHSFQGLGSEALSIVSEIKKSFSFDLITEITDPRQVETLLPHIGAFQVGARNMYNYSLLKELGKTSVPVILKRGFSATVDEWIKASDYLITGGNENVILCERGIRTFETSSRYTFDLNGALVAQNLSGLPVIVDPSHGIGLREYVPRLLLAAAASGLDGAIVEMHPEPDKALSDGRQSLDFISFDEMLPKLDGILNIIGKNRV